LITYGKTSFKLIEHEIEALIQEHWEYVTDDPSMKPDIDWDFYHKTEDLGLLHTLAVRDDEELIGYILLMTIRAPHYKSYVFAHDDAFFLKAQYRKGWSGVRMFREAEKMMKAMGVKRICYHEKLKVPMGKVFEFLGYRPRETIWMKDIL
jgi:hypothetical protein